MAIRIQFGGATLYKPGGDWIHPDVKMKWRLLAFLYQLGIKGQG